MKFRQPLTFGEAPLAIFCIQDDTIYVEGRSVSLDSAETVTEQLQKLEEVLSKLKTEVNGNRLIESQGLSLEAEVLVKQTNSGWLSLRDEIAEPQRFINSLHGLSLLAGDRRAAKLEELKTRYEGTQIERLLGRLFD